jgi:S-formylglutathione hydrolase FrmB
MPHDKSTGSIAFKCRSGYSVLMNGKIVFLEHESKILKDNPLGDPYIRRFPVYLPPEYETSPQKRFPVIFGLTGFTGSGVMYLNKSILNQPFDEILDELIVKKGMPGVIYVMPDCMTYFGGSQYINSSAVGNYEDYIVDEIVPFIDTTLRTTGKRACVGGSSGGIGSFTLAAKHPDVFQAFADHSGDSAFEYCFLTCVPKFVQSMEKYDYDLEKFVRNIPTIQPKDDDFVNLLIMTAMAACYSPNPDVKPLGFELPFDPYTGTIRTEVWFRWTLHDPVNMVEKYRDNLRKLKFCFVDCGKKDQFHLYLGSRQLHLKLGQYGIKHTYEEYDSNHGLLRREQKKKSIPMVVRALMEA